MTELNIIKERRSVSLLTEELVVRNERLILKNRKQTINCGLMVVKKGQRNVIFDFGLFPSKHQFVLLGLAKKKATKKCDQGTDVRIPVWGTMYNKPPTQEQIKFYQAMATRGEPNYSSWVNWVLYHMFNEQGKDIPDTLEKIEYEIRTFPRWLLNALNEFQYSNVEDRKNVYLWEGCRALKSYQWFIRTQRVWAESLRSPMSYLLTNVHNHAVALALSAIKSPVTLPFPASAATNGPIMDERTALQLARPPSPFTDLPERCRTPEQVVPLDLRKLWSPADMTN